MIITKEHIITSLKEDKAFLQNEMGIKSLALFGSYSKDSQTADSDIDFLIELNEVSYKLLCNAFFYIEKKFPGKKIQLIRKGPHVSEKFLKSIENDLMYV